ncbi:MAG: glycosyltransferase [Oceanicaulis sp.]
MKWARTLADAGEDVCILGLWEKSHPSHALILENGTTAYRAKWYQRAQLQLAVAGILSAIIPTLIMLGVAALLLVAAAAIIGVLWEFVEPFLVWLGDAARSLTGLLVDPTVGDLIAPALVLAVILALVVALAFRPVRRALGRALLAPFKLLAWPFVYARRLIQGFSSRVERLSEIEGPGGGGVFMDTLRGYLAPIAASGPREFIQSFFDFDAHKVTAKVRTQSWLEALDEIQPEVIVAQEVLTLPAALKYKKKTGARVIYDAHEIYDELTQGSVRTMRFYRSIHSKAFAEIDGATVVSEKMKDYYAEEYDRPTGIHVVANATEKYGPVEYDGRLHDAAGLPRDRKILLYQGGYSINRHIENVIDCALDLDDEWSSVLMGHGAGEDDFHARVAEVKSEWLGKKRRKLLRAVNLELGEKYDQIAKEYITELRSMADLDHSVLVDRAVTMLNLDAALRGDFQAAERERARREGPEPHRAAPGSVAVLNADASSAQTREPAERGVDFSTFDRDSAAGALFNLLSAIRLYDEVSNQFLEDAYQSARAAAIEADLQDQLAKLERGFDRTAVIKSAPMKDLPLWTSGATVGIIPYRAETLNGWVAAPNKLWEFPNAGVPVLVNGSPTMLEKVQKHGFGWVLPPDPTPKQIAYFVNELTDEEIAEKARHCAPFIEKDGWHAYAKTIRALVNGDAR